MQIDPAVSRISVVTRAEGLLARFAHDLQLASTALRGSWSPDGSGTLTVPVASLRAMGTLRGDRLDPAGLSASDRADIERRLREEVLPVGEVVIEAADGRATVRVGRQGATVAASSRVEGRGDRVRLTGRCTLSLAALGIREVKGPLGAFRVKDAVEVAWELEFVP